MLRFSRHCSTAVPARPRVETTAININTLTRTTNRSTLTLRQRTCTLYKQSTATFASTSISADSHNPTPTASAPSSAPTSKSKPTTALSLSPLWSWGCGHLAGLGHGDYIARSRPTPIGSLSGVEITDVASSWGHNVAVTKYGSIIHWGWKPVMRSWLSVQKYYRRFPRLVRWLQSLGLGRATLNGGDPLLPTRCANWGTEIGDAPTESGDEPLHAVSCSAGSDWCAVLSSEGQVYTFGAGYYGNLGHSAALSETVVLQPKMVTRYQNHHPNESHGRKLELDPDTPPSFPNSPIVQVATGFSHMLILTEQGQVYACGKADTGALGITHIYRDGKRLFLPHLIPVTDAFAASEHGSGEPWIKVSSVEAQEAQSTQWLAAQNDPTIVETYIGPIVQVCAGMKHSLFLNAAGEVYACGTNGLNELGNGTYHPVHGLVKVHLPLAAPGETTAGRRRRRAKEGSSNGSASSSSSSDFFSTEALQAEKIIRIATGMHHCLALSNHGHVYAWGSNLQGQCGVTCAVSAVDSVRSAWNVQRKSFGERSTSNDIDADATAAAEGETTRSKIRGFFSGRHLKPAFNHARRKFIESQCLSPVRLEVEKFELGIPKRDIGRVIDVQAGFYDSVLITDAGHCITFGGGNTSYSQHPPHLFTLKKPTPSSTPTNQPTMSGMEQTDAIENALNQPYRIKKITFGLGHAIALVDKKE